jgi:MFS family permease
LTGFHNVFLHFQKLTLHSPQLSLFLAALDMTIVSTAIPTIASHFHSASGYIWVGSAYLLANAAAAPIWAKLSDIWGRKPILLAAVAVFFLGSILCAAASSMGMLITGRAVQGSAGGGLIILVNICIGDLFSMRFVFHQALFCE